MGEGLKRARDAARATRGLPPVTVHLRSTTGSTYCGGYVSAISVISDVLADVTCRNCLRAHASHAPKVFTWDYKAQPPLAEILAAAREMPGPWFWFMPETGTQEYALILSDRELNADEAERILWERAEG